jgi:CRP-like cAMP-binding protein
MYLIRTGTYQVTIKSNFYSGGKSQPMVETKYLYDGDHFGEIGLIYNTKRTASVISKNYGSLARLSRSGFNDIQKYFPRLTTAFKEYCFKYKDEVSTFLEMESDKI